MLATAKPVYVCVSTGWTDGAGIRYQTVATIIHRRTHQDYCISNSKHTHQTISLVRPPIYSLIPMQFLLLLDPLDHLASRFHFTPSASASASALAFFPACSSLLPFPRRRHTYSLLCYYSFSSLPPSLSLFILLPPPFRRARKTTQHIKSEAASIRSPLSDPPLQCSLQSSTRSPDRGRTRGQILKLCQCSAVHLV